MKRLFLGLIVGVMILPVQGWAEKTEKLATLERETSSSDRAFEKFFVYCDAGAKDNHYMPYGIMGDISDVSVDTSCLDNPHGGKNCIKITYNAHGSRGANWAGMFWQQPANNWGQIGKGFDLRGATQLTFWARGAKGGETVTEFKAGGIAGGDYADTDSASTGTVILTKQWRQYSISLQDKDLSNIIGGFCWVASKENNPKGFVIYIDDVVYE